MAESYSTTAYLRATDMGFTKTFRAAQEAVENFKNKTSSAMKKISSTSSSDLKKANKNIENFKAKAGASAKAIGATVVKGMKVAGAAIGAFTVAGVKSAADLQALDAQFQQTFGSLSGEAQKSVNALGEEFGMLPNRIKPAFTQTTAQFKGLGLTTEESMQQAASATKIAADASAFYDKSLEEAQSALNSFVKGNYEGGESIGLFANETQMASWAAKNLGVDWKTLDEAGKQVIRLQFAEAMQKASGATGQAARESNSLQNQLGNLKSSFSTLAGEVAKPLLQPITNGMAGLSEKMTNIIPKIQKFMEKVSNSTLVQSFAGAVQLLKEKFSNSEGLQIVVDLMKRLGSAILNIDLVSLVESVSAFLDKWGPLIAGIVAGITAFKGLSLAVSGLKIISHAVKGFQIAVKVFGGVRSAAMVLIPAVTGISLPMLAVAAAIGVVVAIGITLWKNWDKIKAKAGELKEKVVGKFNELKEKASNSIENLKTSTSKKWDSIKQGTSSKVETMKNTVSDKFGNIKSNVSSKMSDVKSNISNKWTGAKSATTSKLAGILSVTGSKMGDTVNRVRSKMTDVKSRVSQGWENAKSAAKGKLSSFVTIGGDLIRGFIKGVKNKAKGLINAVTGAVKGAIKKAKSLLKIGSPSKLFRQFGEWTDEGFAIGISGSAKKPLTAAKNMISGIANAWDPNSFNVGNSARNINASVNQTVDHVVTDNMSSARPAYITLNIGGRNFRAFVEDISNVQNAQTQLEASYL